jgi:hypothetical protein
MGSPALQIQEFRSANGLGVCRLRHPDAPPFSSSETGCELRSPEIQIATLK